MTNGKNAKLTRRELAGVMLAATAMAQEAPPATPDDELKAAQARNQETAAALAKAEIPLEAEPAFHFTV